MTTRTRPVLNGLGPRRARWLVDTWSDPAAYAVRACGDALYPKQAEYLRAVRDNRRVSVVGCNTSGKDWTTGRLIPWWFSIFKECKVVVLGPTNRQVKDVVWKEVHTAVSHADANGNPIGGELTTTQWQFTDEKYGLGFATNNPQNVQGFHSPHLLVVITEAHNVEDTFIDAALRLSPERLVMTGNPFTSKGHFFDSFHSKRDQYATIKISAFDTPNVTSGEVQVPGLVTLEDIEERKADWGEDSAMYQASILGEFPDNLDDVIIPLNWVQAAASKDHQIEPEGQHILGLDVARYGTDKTVLVHRNGGHAEIAWRIQGRDVVEVSGYVGRYMEDRPEGGRIVVDAVGIGAGVHDNIKHANIPNWHVTEFSGGSKARQDKRYVDKNAEAWYSLRKAFEDGAIDIPDDPSLVGQLSSRGFTIQGDRRYRLESKDKMREAGRPSPDEADALAMTYTTLATDLSEALFI